MITENSFAKNTLQTLLSVTDEAVTVINTNEETVYWNEAAEKTYHIKKEDIIGKNIKEFFHQDDLMNLQVLQTQQTIIDMYHIPRPNKHVLINAKPIYNENHQLLGAISIEKDITTTIKLNEQLTSTSKELQQLKQQMNQSNLNDAFQSIKGNNSTIQQMIVNAKKVAKTDASVLINGESGVGKELFAQAIHKESLRHDQPFIPINCGAIPHALFESEFFGYESGAYTGALKSGKPGKIELADGGTLFLDEVGELPLDMQVKLLRVLQEKELYRIGGQSAKNVNIRIIAATNRNLEQMIIQGSFRADLYYRLNVFSITIPPLRERVDDILYLTNIFLKELCFTYQKPIPSITFETKQALQEYSWPGNIRELRNVIERLVVLNEHSEITQVDLSHVTHYTRKNTATVSFQISTLSDEKKHLEKERIVQMLKETYGNKSLTAKKLGMSRANLYKKMKKYEIDTNSNKFF